MHGIEANLAQNPSQAFWAVLINQEATHLTDFWQLVDHFPINGARCVGEAG
jgi:hypothetical protein